MSSDVCARALAALVASIERRVELDEESGSHLGQCASCVPLLEAARRRLQEPLPASAEGNVDAICLLAEREVRSRSRLRKAATVFGGLLVAAFFTFLFVRYGWDKASIAMLGAAVIALIIVVVTVVVALPFAALGLIARKSNRSGHRLYKRLGPGRMVSGVCLGIAESTGTSVVLWRTVMAGLLLLDGLGLLLYVLLDAAMHVHPADRQYLLRFRLRRWWHNRSRRAEV